MRPEQHLPQSRTLEQTLNTESDVVRDIVYSHWAQTGDIIDDASEIAHLDSLPTVWIVTSKLAELLTGDETQAERTAYRAFVFAWQTSDLLGSIPSIGLSGYVAELAYSQDPRAKLVADAQQYLESRPTVDQLVTEFAPMIEQGSADNFSVATTISSIAFMLIERGIANDYYQSVIDQIKSNRQ